VISSDIALQDIPICTDGTDRISRYLYSAGVMDYYRQVTYNDLLCSK